MLLPVLLAFSLQHPLTVEVTPPSFVKAMEPQIAIDSDDRVYITYGMGDATYVSISTDKGRSYRQPVKVGEPGRLSLGMRRGPRIAVNKGVVTVTATYGGQGRGRDGDIVAFRSMDKGATWSAPVYINTSAVRLGKGYTPCRSPWTAP